MIVRGLLMMMVLLVVGCGGVGVKDGPGRVSKAKQAPPAVPRQEPLSKYGNPDSYVVFGKTYFPLKTSTGFRQKGVASWYGKKFHGRKTSSGEVYDMYKMTAAHKHLPLPTYVTVRNIKTGQQAIVRVNDRGPFHDDRVIDLSYAAAAKLGVVNSGTAQVEIIALDSRPTTTIVDSALPALEGQTATSVDAEPEEIFSVADNTNAPIHTSGPEDSETIPSIAIDADSQEIYLQIGAFRERGNAILTLERIMSVVPGARIREATADGLPVYRVQVGPIFDPQDAQQYVERLVALGFAEHHFTTP